MRVLIPKRISAASAQDNAQLHRLTGETMATTWSTVIAAPPLSDLTDVRSAIEQVLAGVIAQMSPWEPHSDISHFNRSAAGEWLALPPEFAHVIRCGLEVAALSGGAFDPTAGKAVDAWGFGTGTRFDNPTFSPPRFTGHPARARSWADLRLDERNRLLHPGGVTLNLSAIAKGFAVDAVSQLLTSRGFVHHLVEIGGELRGAGFKPDHQPWWVEVEAPSSGFTLPPTRIALHELAVATSGDYRRFIEINGRRLQHTIDPRTSQPVDHDVASVTVIHKSCMWADAWATALMVLGVEAGLALADQQRLAVLFRRRSPDGTWSEAASTALAEMQE